MHGEEKKTAALNSQEQVDGSADGTGANDAPVADAAPAEHGAEEHAGSSAYVWLMPYQTRNFVLFFLFSVGISSTAMPALPLKPSLLYSFPYFSCVA